MRRTKTEAKGFAKLDAEGKIVGFELFNPVSITVTNQKGDVLESITATRETLAGKLLPTDVFTRSSYLTWTKNLFKHGRLVATREYCNIPAKGDGKKDVDYAETTFGYDVRGRRNIVVSPMGGVTKTVYDWRDNPVEEWVGTTESNLVMVSSSVYGNAGGDCFSCGGGTRNNVLARAVYPNAEHVRVSEYAYDWRGRLKGEIREADANGNFLVSEKIYDNMNRVVATETRLGSEGKRDAGGRLINRTDFRHDNRGRSWQTVHSIVDDKTGKVVNKHDSRTHFNAKGYPIRQADFVTGMVSETVFDSLGRGVINQVSIGKEVVRRSESVFDNTGRTLVKIIGEKQDGKKGMRNRYASFWYDAAGRQTAQTDHGYSEAPISRAKSAKGKVGKGRFSKSIFDKKTGRLARTVDAAGRETDMVYDKRGHAIKAFRRRKNGKNIATESVAETVYNAAGQMIAQIDALGNRTEFRYDPLGRQIARIDAEGGETRFAYNNIGELIEQTDPMGRVTKFEYDNFGRKTKTIIVLEKSAAKKR